MCPSASIVHSRKGNCLGEQAIFFKRMRKGGRGRVWTVLHLHTFDDPLSYIVSQYPTFHVYLGYQARLVRPYVFVLAKRGTLSAEGSRICLVYLSTYLMISLYNVRTIPVKIDAMNCTLRSLVVRPRGSGGFVQYDWSVQMWSRP